VNSNSTRSMPANNEDVAEVVGRTCALVGKRSLDMVDNLLVFSSGSPHSSAEMSVHGVPSPNSLEGLLFVGSPGPPDFGGCLAEFLWGVRVEYCAAIEYLLLSCRLSKEDPRKEIGVRRIERPDLHALLRCSRQVRVGTIAAARLRGTIQDRASEEQRNVYQELYTSLRQHYPVSWAAAGLAACSLGISLS